MENFDLTVQPASVVAGRISLGGNPVSDSENGMRQSLSNPRIPRIGKTTSRPRPPTPPTVFFHKFTTDAEGRYRVELDPFDYEMSRYACRIRTSFELTDQCEFQLDFLEQTAE